MYSKILFWDCQSFLEESIGRQRLPSAVRKKYLVFRQDANVNVGEEIRHSSGGIPNRITLKWLSSWSVIVWNTSINEATSTEKHVHRETGQPRDYNDWQSPTFTLASWRNTKYFFLTADGSLCRQSTLQETIDSCASIFGICIDMYLFTYSCLRPIFPCVSAVCCNPMSILESLIGLKSITVAVSPCQNYLETYLGILESITSRIYPLFDLSWPVLGCWQWRS